MMLRLSSGSFTRRSASFTIVSVIGSAASPASPGGAAPSAGVVAGGVVGAAADCSGAVPPLGNSVVSTPQDRGSDGGGQGSGAPLGAPPGHCFRFFFAGAAFAELVRAGFFAAVALLFAFAFDEPADAFAFAAFDLVALALVAFALVVSGWRFTVDLSRAATTLPFVPFALALAAPRLLWAAAERRRPALDALAAFFLALERRAAAAARLRADLLRLAERLR